MLTTTVFAISSLAYRSSKDTIEKAVSALDGVIETDVSLFSRTMQVTYDDEITSVRRIIEAVDNCGYTAFVQSEETEVIDLPMRTKPAKKDIIRTILFFVILLCAILHVTQWIGFLCTTIILILSKDTLSKGFSFHNKKRTNDDTMSTITILLSYLASIVTILMQKPAVPFLLAASGTAILHEILIKKLKDHDRKNAGIMEKKEKLPTYARVYTDHHEDMVHSSSLKGNELIVLRPGNVVPADGVVVKGFARIDESRLSGKKTPVEKRENAHLYANSVVLEGALTMRVEQTGATTAMMRLRLMAEDTARSHRSATPLSGFGRALFPYMCLAALITFIGWYFAEGQWMMALAAALSVCATQCTTAFSLASSEPVIHTAMDSADHHILFKDIRSLSSLSMMDAVIIEENGTITSHDLMVTDFIPADDVPASHLEYIIYALLSKSRQPFSKAVIRYLRTKKVSDVQDKGDFISLNRRGRSIYNSVGRCTYGTPEHLAKDGIGIAAWHETIQHLQEEGKQVMLFVEDGRIIGAVATRRPILEGTMHTLKALQAKEITTIVIARGEENEAAWLKKQIPVDELLYNPDEAALRNKMRTLKQEGLCIAYISNTHPEHFEDVADICIASDCGTDIARSGCGILLTRDSLEDFYQAIQNSESMGKTIRKGQSAVVFYHVIMVILMGIAIPALFHFTFPIFLSAAFPLLISLIILHKTTKD